MTMYIQQEDKTRTSGNSSGTLPIHVKDNIEQSLLALTVRSKCKCMAYIFTSKSNLPVLIFAVT